MNSLAIPGFRRDLDEISTLLVYDTAQSGS